MFLIPLPRFVVYGARFETQPLRFYMWYTRRGNQVLRSVAPAMQYPSPGSCAMSRNSLMNLRGVWGMHAKRQAMQYFWRVLDVQGKGGLTISTIHLFFRDIARALEEGGFETPTTDDVKVCYLFPDPFFFSCSSYFFLHPWRSKQPSGLAYAGPTSYLKPLPSW